MIVEAVSGFYAQLDTVSVPVYNTIAISSQTPPYCTFGLLTETPVGDFNDFEAVEDLTFWVNCFASNSIAGAYTLADAVMTVLDGATVNATGYTWMKCVREFIGNAVWDEDTNIFQVPMRFRVWLDKA